ncbi:YoaK family protein [Pantoea ananatis]|uniref:YoaK family protein n=1 Tax=Pantoea ananas TaxID=553 RepID=UPI00188E4FBB|nr:YoaK family protein [Pantoea ananatis]
MLVRKKRMRSHSEDRHLALTMATTAGMLNTMALCAFGIFPSHMSGNTSQISAEVFSSNFSKLTLLIGLIAAFLAGCTIARLITLLGEMLKIRTIFCIILILEGVILATASLFESLFYSPLHNSGLLATMAFMMGLHNTTSTQLSNGRVRSTHITGTITDVGIALGTYIWSFIIPKTLCNRYFAYKQLCTHLITIVCFLSGCITGMLLFKGYAFRAMLAIAIILIIYATTAIVMTLHNVRNFKKRSTIT